MLFPQVFKFVGELTGDLAALFQTAFTALMREFKAVTLRQLQDFLVGGQFAMPASPQQRLDMAHCALNNLFGEACLADLDFNMFRRRNCSVHVHSTINMFKRNNPISNFLLLQCPAKQAEILRFARRVAAALRETHRHKEKAVIIER